MENENQEQVEPEETVEPHGDKTDWRAESRKWEGRAKENAKARKELDALKASSEETAAKLAEAQAQIESMKAEKARDELLRKISAETGVPENLIAGADEAAMRANAEAQAAWAKSLSQPKYPVVGEGHGRKPEGGPVSRDELAAIRNPRERFDAIRNNQELFRKK